MDSLTSVIRPPGVSAGQAQAVQGVAGGVPIPVSATSTDTNLTALIAALNQLGYKIPPLVTAKDPVDPRGVALPVNVAQLPLPQHAATDTLQAATNALLAVIAANTPAPINGREPVDGSGVTQPISVAALPLPVGASTDSTQAQVRRNQELEFLQIADQNLEALRSRGPERVSLFLNRGGR